MVSYVRHVEFSIKPFDLLLATERDEGLYYGKVFANDQFTKCDLLSL